MSTTPTVEILATPTGLVDCPGFKVSGIAADIRETGDRNRLDLALIVADTPCPAAGVFTLNDLCAAPVQLCKIILENSAECIAGIVVNSGNANAATGEQGLLDAKQMSTFAQSQTGIGSPFLVCSTGRIGRKLPMMRIDAGISDAAQKLSSGTTASQQVADAILTSDTRNKCATAQFEIEGKKITVAGIAKGAGMIEPNMATMLAFLVTDIQAEAALLKTILKNACDQSFNCISIDGDMSTNDSVLLMANGHSGVTLNNSTENLIYKAFASAVLEVCAQLAEKIVGDGEKITKLVELKVEGCLSNADAEKVARAVGNSLLVKTSWYGNDPNWGRLADAAGYARVGLKADSLDIRYNDCPALVKGVPQDDKIQEWQSVVSEPRFTVTMNLNLGAGHYRLLTTDLSEAYVDFNKSE
ncbi:MAG: Arginine biosynthesis bifunctional protein ArgJ [Opitutia bacterium UBA7350]|nr:MAG: Arginine biosynthesis bifunctional protein ArgJ [Opitutae bacterium UBA7350]